MSGTKKLLLAFALLAILRVPGSEAKTVYVDAIAEGMGDGMSWTSAFRDLQLAFEVALASDEIWVASGVYHPGPLREDSFELKSGVEVYGGFGGSSSTQFPGGETSRNQRDPETNRTVLSGQRPPSMPPPGNTLHVIRATDVDHTALLDGFIVRDGEANGIGIDGVGGGLLAIESNPTIQRCVFRDNVALDFGGAIYRTHSLPTTDQMTIVSSRFVNNQTTAPNSEGGAIYSDGGGTSLRSDIFIMNLAVGAGGGAVLLGPCEVVNNTFSLNRAIDPGIGQGGGLIVSGIGSISNSIFWENQAATDPQLFSDGVPVFRTLIQGGGFPGPGNFDRAPRFADPTNFDFSLSPESPCIDTGSDQFLPQDSTDLDGDGDVTEPLPLDLRGDPRAVDDPNSIEIGEGPIVDRGAFEFQPAFLKTPTGLRGAAAGAEVRLVWNRTIEPHLAGYNVYRSATPDGPFEGPLNGTDLLTDPLFVDDLTKGLPGTTESFYFVESVGLGGQTSEPSMIIAILIGFRPFFVPDRSAGPGDRVRFPIASLNTDGIEEMTATLTYPSALLNYVGVELPPLTSGNQLTVDPNNPNVVYIHFRRTESLPIAGEGSLVDLIFDVDVAAATGMIETLTMEVTYIENGFSLLSYSESRFRVGRTFQLGNADLIGDVTQEDVLLVRRSALGRTTFKSDVLDIADINSDGVVDMADVILIQRLRDGLSLTPGGSPRKSAPKGPAPTYSIVAATGSYASPGAMTTVGIALDFPSSVKGATSEGIAGLAFTLLYDPLLSTVDSIATTPLAAGFELSILGESYFRINEPGVIRLAMSSTGNQAAQDGVWLNVNFQDISAPSAPQGTQSPVMFSSAKMCTQFGEDLAWYNIVQPIDGSLVYGNPPEPTDTPTSSPTPTGTPVSTPTNTAPPVDTATPTPTDVPQTSLTPTEGPSPTSTETLTFTPTSTEVPCLNSDPVCLLEVLAQIRFGEGEASDLLEFAVGWMD